TVGAATAKVARDSKLTIAPSMIRPMVSQRMPRKRRIIPPLARPRAGLVVILAATALVRTLTGAADLVTLPSKLSKINTRRRRWRKSHVGVLRAGLCWGPRVWRLPLGPKPPPLPRR